MKISNINEFKRSFEKLQWLFKTFEAQNFEDLSPMEIEFFLEILGRLSSTVNLSDAQEISSHNPTLEKSNEEVVPPPQKAAEIKEQQKIIDNLPSQEEEEEDIPLTKEHSSTAEAETPEQQQKNPVPSQPVEETKKPSAEAVEEVPKEQSGVTLKNPTETSSTPKNIVDQFRNNSPSIADRAQKKTDDSTSHLLKRGGHLRLNSLIDLNRRFLIINDVFGGKRINFDKEVEFIDQLPDLDSAMNHLNSNLVKTYNVNTTTKGFEILNKVVARRFAS
ncbi:MAG: hypothetical protein CMN34_06630 [Saprospirales bacterium]|nr:hypothetical protein [Saprospirales bacterium]|tara:strand:- start:770 stop:1597 length:828 start_codon:yes stop_codon:yes gene_type:complete